MHDDSTKVYTALYKKELILFLPSKFFAAEIIICALIAFVIKIYGLLIVVLIIHITSAIIYKNEPEIINVFLFLLSVKGEENAKLP